MSFSTEFPLRKIPTHLGLILDPTIPVEILTLNGFTPFDLLLDTGADATLLPRFMAKVVGLELNRLPRQRMFGIENQEGLEARRGKVTLRIAKHTFSAPAFFSESDASPLVLGRAGFFDHFNITFDNKRFKIILKTIR